MIVSIHQPNYLPWLGYFYKLYASDVFVFHDTVAYGKASYTKRCPIRLEKESEKSAWLSVPVRKHADDALISSIRISQATDWAGSHLRKIENTYRTAPYFTQMIAWLAPALKEAAGSEFLSDCNIALIRTVADALHLETEYCNSSALPVEGKASELNLNIVRHLGGTHYLAGKGSDVYEDRTAFDNAGISITTHDLGAWLQSHPYDQGTGSFANGMSIVDALMHIGPDGIGQIFDAFHNSSFGKM